MSEDPMKLCVHRVFKQTMYRLLVPADFLQTQSLYLHLKRSTYYLCNISHRRVHDANGAFYWCMPEELRVIFFVVKPGYKVTSSMHIFKVGNPPVNCTPEVKALLGYEGARFTCPLGVGLIDPDSLPVFIYFYKQVWKPFALKRRISKRSFSANEEALAMMKESRIQDVRVRFSE